MPRPRKQRASQKRAEQLKLAAAGNGQSLARQTQARAPLAVPLPRLKQYLERLSPQSREAFAARCDTSLAYIEQIANGWNGRTPTTDMAIKMERASYGFVRCEDLLPNGPWDYLRWRPAKDQSYDRLKAPAVTA